MTGPIASLSAGVDLTWLDSTAVRVAIGVVVLVVLYFLIYELRKIPAKLHVLMFTAFLDMVGVFLVIPLLPFYVTRLGGGALVVGVLVSAFSVAQLLSAPMWGRFSDRFGRRPTLLVALGASVIAYVIFGYATSLLMLFLSRIVQGAGGGTVGVIQAYVADATEPKDRAKSLGWLSAATNLGVALGPVLGSWAAMVGAKQFAIGGSTYSIGPAAPGLFAAALCALNMIFAWRYLTESKMTTGEMEAARAASTKPPSTARVAIKRVLTHPSDPAPRLIWIYATTMGAFRGATAMLAPFLAVAFAITEHTIGYFFGYIGVISVLTRVLVLGRLVDRLGEPRLSRLGMVLLAVGIGGLPIASSLAALAFFVALIPLGTAFTFPCVTAMLSRVVDAHERGLYMGVQQTFGGISVVAFPILMGAMFDRLGHGWPFYTSATLVLLTITLGFGMEGYIRPKATTVA
jgi:MFS family permease